MATDRDVKHIAIAGNIASGKTTLTEMLSRHYGWKPILEPVDDNPYLEDFYADMHRWAFHLQIYFLNHRFKQVKDIRVDGIPSVQDRTIYEDAHIFAKALHESGYIKSRDYSNYLDIYESMVSLVEPPDLLVYLQADIPRLVSQIQKRGRDYENAIRLDYLKNLNRHYEDWIANYTAGNLLVVNVNNIDFVSNDDDFSDIVQRIDRELFGLFS